MKISKALKKERKGKKIFFLLMLILFIILPVTTFLSGFKSMFLWSYVIFVEFLITLAVLANGNYYRLNFTCNNNKLRFKSGLFSKENLIFCDKVSVVHTNKDKEELEIILITSVNFKNKLLKPITKTFLKRYPEVTPEYIKVKTLLPENIYYFQIIRRGGFKKYQLLDVIYKNCVRATYTSSAIDNIKIAREQIEI